MLWWKESLTTGIEKIDQQHKSIFNKTEEILSLNKISQRDKINQAFRFLVEYALSHFGEEEKIMIEFSYPDFLKHRQEHNYFIKGIFEINQKLSQQELIEEAIDELKLLVIEWLSNHITESDQKFVDFYHNKSTERASTNS